MPGIKIQKESGAANPLRHHSEGVAPVKMFAVVDCWQPNHLAHHCWVWCSFFHSRGISLIPKHSRCIFWDFSLLIVFCKVLNMINFTCCCSSRWHIPSFHEIKHLVLPGSATQGLQYWSTIHLHRNARKLNEIFFIEQDIHEFKIITILAMTRVHEPFLPWLCSFPRNLLPS